MLWLFTLNDHPFIGKQSTFSIGWPCASLCRCALAYWSGLAATLNIFQLPQRHEGIKVHKERLMKIYELYTFLKAGSHLLLKRFV